MPFGGANTTARRFVFPSFVKATERCWACNPPLPPGSRNFPNASRPDGGSGSMAPGSPMRADRPVAASCPRRRAAASRRWTATSTAAACPGHSRTEWMCRAAPGPRRGRAGRRARCSDAGGRRSRRASARCGRGPVPHRRARDRDALLRGLRRHPRVARCQPPVPLGGPCRCHRIMAPRQPLRAGKECREPRDDAAASRR